MPHTQISGADLLILLQAKWENVPFWTSNDGINAINEALRVWNLFTGYWKKKLVVPNTANQVWFTLDLTLIYPLRGEWQGLPVTTTSVYDLDYGRPGWESETTSSGGDVPTRPKHIIPKGLTLFALWPAPATASNSLTLDSVRVTPTVSNSALSFVDIGEDEINTLLGMALHIATFKHGGPRWKSTMHYYQEFIKAAGERNGMLKASTFYRKALGLDLGKSQRPIKYPVDLAKLAGAN